VFCTFWRPDYFAIFHVRDTFPVSAAVNPAIVTAGPLDILPACFTLRAITNFQAHSDLPLRAITLRTYPHFAGMAFAVSE
jgi:hypothetical protein